MAGRRPLSSTPQVGPDFVTATPAEVAVLGALETEIQARQETALTKFGDGLPYDRFRYVDKCRYHMSRSAEEALEVGRCLIVMKEHEGHGAWLPVLEDVGIDARLAQRMMQAAARLSNAALTPHLVEAAKSKTKLLELMVLDDEEMESLGAGGTVRDLTLDDVDRMSVSELRKALRKTRADKEAEVAKAKADVSADLAAKDRVIADKTKRIADLVEEKNRQEHLTDAERHAELEAELNKVVMVALGSIQAVASTIGRIHQLEEGIPKGLGSAMSHALSRVADEVMYVASDWGISIESGLQPIEEGFDDPNAGEVFEAQ